MRSNIGVFMFNPWTAVTKFAVAALLGFSSLASAEDFVFEASVPEAVKAQFVSDMKWLESVRGKQASKMFQEAFFTTDLAGRDIKNYLIEHIGTVVYTPEGDVAQSIMEVKRFGAKGKVMLHALFLELNSNFTPLKRINLLVHEARHMEFKVKHDDCPTPYLDANQQPIRSLLSGVELSGIPGCDSSELGSYGLQATFLLNIAEFCTSCGEEVRQQARELSVDALNRYPIEKQRQIFIDDVN